MKSMMIAMLVLALASPAAAGPVETSYVHRAGTKLAHGLADIAWSPMETLVTPVMGGMEWETRYDRPLVGFLVGIPVGIYGAAGRSIRGSIDVLTFPIASMKFDSWSWDWAMAFNLMMKQEVD